MSMSESSTRLLLIGSDCSNTCNVIEIYDQNHNRWVKPNNLAIDRINYSVAVIDNKIMLIGGSESQNQNIEPLNIVQSLDLSTGLLWMEAPLNESRQYAATVGLNKGKMSFVCVFGGRGRSGDLESVERWDATSRVWTYMKPMRTKRSGLAAAILEDKIYILGGRIGDGYTNTMEAYYQEEGQWKMKAPMKEARAHFCVGISEGYMYAVAGSKIDTHINTVEKYDPSNDSWVTIANIMSSGHVGVSSLGNKLICAGGLQSKLVFKYCSKTNHWLKVQDMHEPRSGYLLQLPEIMKNLRFDWDDQMIQRKLLMIQNYEFTTVKTFEVFDNRTNQWTHLRDLDIGSTNNSVVCIGNILMMIGSTTVENNLFKQSISINLVSGRVEQIAPLNYHRQKSAAVVVKHGIFTFVYAIGGRTVERALNSVERWDSLSRTWAMVTPMMIARTGHGAVLLQNKIYVVGGKTEKGNYYKTVEAYDLENDIWTTKCPMNNAKAHFGITTFKNHIFVVGGNRDPATPLNIVERYDPLQNIWTPIANILSKGAVGISSMGDRLICAGGKSSNIVQEYDENDNKWHQLSSMKNALPGTLIEVQPETEIHSGNWCGLLLMFLGHSKSNVKHVEIFNILKNQWAHVNDLPISKTYYDVNIISNKLLIIGGYDVQILDTVIAIDLISGDVESFPILREERLGASSAVVSYEEQQILYVIGGYKYDEFLSSVEKWDSLTNEWTEGISMPTARYGLGSVVLNGIIYAVGGYFNTSIDIMEAFDVKSNKWVSKAPMHHARRYFGITIFENKIYVAGGYKNHTVERYDPENDTWTILASIESSGKVGLCVIGDRLICAGGKKNILQQYDTIKNEWISLPSMISKEIQYGYLFELPENSVFANGSPYIYVENSYMKPEPIYCKAE